MRLLIADKMDLRPLEELRLLGVELVYQPDTPSAELAAALEGISILVVRSTKVTAEAIAGAKQLNLIVRAGAGVNTIDVAAASARGVYVANCPGKNASAVAELALGLVLALDRRIVDATVGLRAGQWEKTKYSSARGVRGARLGVAGLGAIGAMVVELATPFEMETSAWSRSLTPTRAGRLGVHRCTSLEELASRSEIFTIHLPLNSRTRGVVGRSVLGALPDEAIVVNTARAEVLDYDALAELVPKKGLRVGLDVFSREPVEGTGVFSDPIFQAGLVYGTPHIGASTEQAQRAIGRETCRIVRAFLTEEEVPNVVNVCRNTPARYALVLRALDKVGVLANVLNVIKRHGLNVEEVTNTVFEGAQATCTKLRLSGRPSDACMREIAAFDEILHVDVVPLPNLA